VCFTGSGTGGKRSCQQQGEEYGENQIFKGPEYPRNNHKPKVHEISFNKQVTHACLQSILVATETRKHKNPQKEFREF
jgi:hypothetical protein